MMKGFAQSYTSYNIRGVDVVIEAAIQSKKKMSILSSYAKKGGGGTIGPKVEQLNGICTVDIGSPMLGMHSYRETMVMEDMKRQYSVILKIYDNYVEIMKRSESMPKE